MDQSTQCIYQEIKLRKNNRKRMFTMEVFDAPSHYYPSDAMSLDELSYWITFNRVSGIGPVSFKSLLGAPLRG